MKKIILLLPIFLFLLRLWGCTLIEPVCLSIKNDSDYTITVSFDKGLKEEMVLNKNKGDFTLVYPGNTLITITIPELGYKAEFPLDLKFNEKSTFVFRLLE